MWQNGMAMAVAFEKAEEEIGGDKASVRNQIDRSKGDSQLDLVRKSQCDVLKTFEGYVFGWFVNLLFLPTVTSLLIEIRCSRPAFRRNAANKWLGQFDITWCSTCLGLGE